jgi:hypothetical protein
MIVHVVGKGQPISRAQYFQRTNVTPTRLLFHDFCIKQIAAVVVDAGNKVELIGNVGRPSVVGRIVLNELSGMMRDYLVVMNDPVRLSDIKAVFFALSMMVGRDTFSR